MLLTPFYIFLIYFNKVNGNLIENISFLKPNSTMLNLAACGHAGPKFSDSDSESKIINGNTAKPNSWPWMVSLRYQNRHICGGTLIHEQYVLTAAHCVTGKTASSFKIVVGLHQVNNFSPSQVFEVVKLIKHESFIEAFFTRGYDIALVKLKNPVNLSTTVSIICLPVVKDADAVIGKYVRAIGWGRIDTSFTPAFPSELQEAKLKVANNEPICKQRNYNLKILYCLYDDTNTIEQSQVCNGDSGGPFFYRFDNQWFLYGIVSFGQVDTNGNKAKCSTKRPSFFTNVPHFVEWINRNIE